MSGEKRLISCVRCGGEFLGGADARFCPDCRTIRIREGVREKFQAEPEIGKTGWRHMLRDRTGTVIVPGGNVMDALDALCAYEEACEAFGIKGPGALRKALERANGQQGTGRTDCHGPASPRNDSTGEDGENEPQAPREKRPRWRRGAFCEGCAFFRPTVPGGGHGICRIHKRRIRPEGGKGQKYLELDEPRQVAARRVACGDWTDKDGSKPPQWVGPSAELMPEDT